MISRITAGTSNLFSQAVSCDHSVSFLYSAAFAAASSDFLIRASCSARGSESSFWLFSVSFAIKTRALSKTPPCVIPTSIMMMGLNDFRLSSLMLAPASTQGTIKKAHGRVPSSICGQLSRRMPVSTEVGQSGPPQRIATFSIVKPLFFRIFSIARMFVVCTPTNCCTYRDLPNSSPIPFCCRTTAFSLSASDSTDAKAIPVQKSSQGSCLPRSTMIVPAAM
mmetsp:Transcript_38546/g.71357  ORF Transcript_38546/g.71357 Transcript_38546/m.71357 type:complete len:222 (+) Transcript_38546:372-1037(+)